MTITTHPNRSASRVGVNRDGKSVGYAARIKATSKRPESWTAFVNIEQPPFDVARPGFASVADAVAFLAQYGHAR